MGETACNFSKATPPSGSRVKSKRKTSHGTSFQSSPANRLAIFTNCGSLVIFPPVTLACPRSTLSRSEASPLIRPDARSARSGGSKRARSMSCQDNSPDHAPDSSAAEPASIPPSASRKANPPIFQAFPSCEAEIRSISSAAAPGPAAVPPRAEKDHVPPSRTARAAVSRSIHPSCEAWRRVRRPTSRSTGGHGTARSAVGATGAGAGDVSARSARTNSAAPISTCSGWASGSNNCFHPTAARTSVARTCVSRSGPPDHAAWPARSTPLRQLTSRNSILPPAAAPSVWARRRSSHALTMASRPRNKAAASSTSKAKAAAAARPKIMGSLNHRPCPLARIGWPGARGILVHGRRNDYLCPCRRESLPIPSAGQAETPSDSQRPCGGCAKISSSFSTRRKSGG